LWVGAVLNRTFQGPNSADPFLEFLLGVPIGFNEGLCRFAQIVEVTQLFSAF